MAKKNIAENIEIQEAPVNPMEEIRKKVDEAVREKIDAMVKVFQDEREKDLAELESLNQTLKSLEDKKSKFLAEKVSLTSGIHGIGVKGVFDLDLKLREVEKQIVSTQTMIGKVFSRLTEVPELSFPLLNFLTRKV